MLVCEIVSPSNAATGRVLKMHYYAEHASAKPGVPLRMDAPAKVESDPASLLRRY